MTDFSHCNYGGLQTLLASESSQVRAIDGIGEQWRQTAASPRRVNCKQKRIVLMPGLNIGNGKDNILGKEDLEAYVSRLVNFKLVFYGFQCP